jgi:hypothetical protein
VRVVLNGQLAEGFVKSEFLRALSAAAPAAAPAEPITATTDIPPVHLKEGRGDITRQRNGGQAFPLGEPGMPRRTGSDPATKVRQLLAIVDYLDTEKKAHARYGPKTTATYCTSTRTTTATSPESICHACSGRRRRCCGCATAGRAGAL